MKMSGQIAFVVLRPKFRFFHLTSEIYYRKSKAMALALAMAMAIP